MLWVPAVRSSIPVVRLAVQVAAQPSVPVPRTLDPSLNVTVPESPLAGELTVAVKVTGYPYTVDGSELATTVVVGALAIVMLRSKSSAAL